MSKHNNKFPFNHPVIEGLGIAFCFALLYGLFKMFIFLSG